MPKLIITTVGTSIISEGIYDSKYSHEITELENGTKSENIGNYNDLLKSSKDALLRSISNDHYSMKKLSAELASLKIFKKTKGIDKNDVIVLFASDTEDGKFCAQVIYEVLEQKKLCDTIIQKTITGFKIKEPETGKNIANDFKDHGFPNFIIEVGDILKTYTTIEERYFNITGGFKAIVPFSTILAFLKKMTIIYLYEKSKDLVFIAPPEEFIFDLDNFKKKNIKIVSPSGSDKKAVPSDLSG